KVGFYYGSGIGIRGAASHLVLLRNKRYSKQVFLASYEATEKHLQKGFESHITIKNKNPLKKWAFILAAE
ncbi:MAG: hypothetical protein IIU65_00005, partial [Clostridia bacterium]|nr:hypothetical protein [Clostridia bacterium]